jgi:LmbE family N-acetylglucosaminyl deacetylase
MPNPKKTRANKSDHHSAIPKASSSVTSHKKSARAIVLPVETKLRRNNRRPLISLLLGALLLVGVPFGYQATTGENVLGEHKDDSHLNASLKQTRGPKIASQLPDTTCAATTNAVSIVAHEDDDLLFQSPDIIQLIHSGSCLRTIYMTAGDAANSQEYWQSRERGSEAAYATMLGQPDLQWTQSLVQLAPQASVTEAHPNGNTSVSLIFMHLPDGNLDGRGFKSTNYGSLARLDNGRIKLLSSVDSLSTYSRDRLVSVLELILKVYKPTLVLSQTPYNAGKTFQDHSDHMAAGRFARASLQQLDPSGVIPAKYYTGYPIHEMPANVSETDQQAKAEAFFAYAKYDAAVCQSALACQPLPIGAYLQRQYVSN